MTKGNIKYVRISSFPVLTNGKDKKDGLPKFQEIKEENTHVEALVDKHTKELAELTSSNTQLLSIIAHDLRSPFGSIIGALEVLRLKMSKGNKDEIEMLVNMASESAKTTLNLLDSLLTWAFSQRNGKPVKVEISLNELLTEETLIYYASVHQKQIKLSLSLTANLKLKADPGMIRVVIRNIIDNAVKYTPKGGEITIGAMENGQLIEITIKDNGIGFGIEARENFLKPDTLTSAGAACVTTAGLGLLLCKELVHIHKGNIRLESQPGMGSEFTISLPRYG
jgi:two-component system, sensor histidine kinase and response regulator